MTEQLKILPCPFCGGDKPKIFQGKKGSCQLRGEPYQSIIIKCEKDRCPVKPKVEAGDIYCGGYEQAKRAAVAKWNTRADDTKENHSTKIKPDCELSELDVNKSPNIEGKAVCQADLELNEKAFRCANNAYWYEPTSMITGQPMNSENSLRAAIRAYLEALPKGGDDA